jgi:hypothetical protein
VAVRVGEAASVTVTAVVAVGVFVTVGVAVGALVLVGPCVMVGVEVTVGVDEGQVTAVVPLLETLFVSSVSLTTLLMSTPALNTSEAQLVTVPVRSSWTP